MITPGEFDYIARSNLGEDDKDNIIPIFETRLIQDEAQSAAQGRPIYNEVEFIKLIIPGDKNTEIVRPLRPDDEFKRRYASKYNAWRDTKRTPIEGTPLSEWPEISRSMAEELKYFNIFTVEHMASVNEALFDRMPGKSREMCQKAQVWLKKADASALVNENNKLHSENRELQAECRKLLDETLKLQASMRQNMRENAPYDLPNVLRVDDPATISEPSFNERYSMAPEAPKRRGRPPKVINDAA